jgi:hypothetical protein
MMRSATLVPVAAGVAVTVIVQAAPLIRGVVQPLDGSNSAALEPVISTALMMSGALPLFFTVTILGAEVMSFSITPKLIDRGLTAIIGRFRKVAVTRISPVMETVQVFPAEDVHPFHSARTEPVRGFAVIVTSSPRL